MTMVSTPDIEDAFQPTPMPAMEPPPVADGGLDADPARRALGKIRAKFPQYDHLDDGDLANRVIQRYPTYGPILSPITKAKPATTPAGALQAVTDVIDRAITASPSRYAPSVPDMMPSVQPPGSALTQQGRRAKQSLDTVKLVHPEAAGLLDQDIARQFSGAMPELKVIVDPVEAARDHAMSIGDIEAARLLEGQIQTRKTAQRTVQSVQQAAMVAPPGGATGLVSADIGGGKVRADVAAGMQQNIDREQADASQKRATLDAEQMEVAAIKSRRVQRNALQLRQTRPDLFDFHAMAANDQGLLGDDRLRYVLDSATRSGEFLPPEDREETIARQQGIELERATLAAIRSVGELPGQTEDQALDEYRRLPDDDPYKQTVARRAQSIAFPGRPFNPALMPLDRTTLDEIWVMVKRGTIQLAQPGEAATKLVAQAVVPAGGERQVVEDLSRVRPLLEANRPSTTLSTGQRLLVSAGEMLPQLAVQVAGTVATGGAAAGFLVPAVAQTMGSSYNDTLDTLMAAGIDPTQANVTALAKASADGLITALSSRAEFGFLSKSEAARRVVQQGLMRRLAGRVGTGATAEGMQEFIEQAGQEATDAIARAVNDVPGVPIEERLRRAFEAGAVGGIAGGAMGPLLRGGRDTSPPPSPAATPTPAAAPARSRGPLSSLVDEPTTADQDARQRAVETLATFRRDYPDYDTLSDEDFARRIAGKFPSYADTLSPIYDEVSPDQVSIATPFDELIDEARSLQQKVEQLRAEVSQQGKPSTPAPAPATPAKAAGKSADEPPTLFTAPSANAGTPADPVSPPSQTVATVPAEPESAPPSADTFDMANPPFEAAAPTPGKRKRVDPASIGVDPANLGKMSSGELLAVAQRAGLPAMPSPRTFTERHRLLTAIRRMLGLAETRARKFTRAEVEEKLTEAMEGESSPLDTLAEKLTAYRQSARNTPEFEDRTGFVFHPDEWADLQKSDPALFARLKAEGFYANEDEANEIQQAGGRAYDQARDYLVAGGNVDDRLHDFTRRVLKNEDHYDPEIVLRAFLHDRWSTLTPDQRKRGFETVKPDKLKPGWRVTIAGEEFTVIEDESGDMFLQDGVTIRADEVPIDRGSLEPPSDSAPPPPVAPSPKTPAADESKPAKPTQPDELSDEDERRLIQEGDALPTSAPAEPAAGRPTGQQLGLLGDRYAGGVTGSKTRPLFETQQETSPAIREDQAFRQQQTPPDQETGSLLEQLHRSEQGAVPIAQLADRLGLAAFHVLTSPVAAIGRLGKWAVDWWSKPLLRRVEDQGKHVGKQIAQLSRQAVDASRKFLGEVAIDLKRVQHLANGATPASRKAVRQLSAVDWFTATSTPDVAYGFARFQGAVEDTAPMPAGKHAAAIVEGYRKLVLDTGTQAEGLGMKIYNSATDSWIPFTKTPGGKKFLRMPTEELHDILRLGPSSPAYSALATALADANNIAQPLALQQLALMRERAVTRRANFEILRVFDRFPTHLRLQPTAGMHDTIPLLRGDPYSAATSLAENSALRLGFVKAFGQDIDASVSRPMIEHFVQAGGNEKDAENLFRALHGMPIDEAAGYLAKPGTAAHQGMRTFRMLLGLYRTMLLTRSAIPNLTEPLAKTPALAGVGRWARAWYELVRHPREMATETARLGARTVATMNLTMEPGRAREGITRMARELGLRLTGSIPVNEMNELHAATAGLVFAGDLKAARGTMFDRVRLELMGFTDPQVDELVSGKASDDLYQATITRFAEWTQGSTSLPAERSKKAGSRLAGALLAFDSYGQFTMDRVARVNRVLFDALKDAKTNPKRAMAAASVAAQFYLGSAASGAGAMLLLTLAVGGAPALFLKLREAEEDPAAFALESAKYALLSGPADAAVQVAAGDHGFEPAIRAVLPISVLNELRQLFSEEGRYRDQAVGDRWLTFLRGNLPITKVVTSTAAMIGLDDRDQARDAAISAYWRWRIENYGRPAQGEQNPTAGHVAFRRAMRKGVEALRAGDDAAPFVLEALGVDGKDEKSVASSLRARRLLPDVKPQDIPALRQKLGDELFDKLVTWDGILDAWADAIAPPRRK